MKVGIDLDNTISDLPEFFAVLANALVDAGHEVHIITDRELGTDGRVRAELDDFGIRYTRLHLPTTAGSAPEWKAGLAADLALDLMIEDSPEVLAAMPDSVQRFWVCDPEVFDLGVCVRAMRAARSETQRAEAEDGDPGLR